jgi:hypothetical protein
LVKDPSYKWHKPNPDFEVLANIVRVIRRQCAISQLALNEPDELIAKSYLAIRARS